MTDARQNKKMTRSTFDGEEVKVGVENLAKVEKVTGAKPAAFGTLQPEAESAFQVIEIAIRDGCLIKDGSINELEDFHWL